MTDVQLGLDATMLRATEEELGLWRAQVKALKDGEFKRKVKDVENRILSPKYYRTRVNAFGEEIAEKRLKAKLATSSEPSISDLPPLMYRDFPVGRPSASHTSLTGRGMKAYLSLDLTSKKFLFIKDSWREDYSVNAIISDEFPLPELVTYAELRRNEVKNIASVVSGGEVCEEGSVRPQRTLVHRYITFNDGKRVRKEEELEEAISHKGKEKDAVVERINALDGTDPQLSVSLVVSTLGT